jgi:hypothetical protein
MLIAPRHRKRGLSVIASQFKKTLSAAAPARKKLLGHIEGAWTTSRARRPIPTIFANPDFATAGGLMS